jgi:hypothetical protein
MLKPALIAASALTLVALPASAEARQQPYQAPYGYNYGGYNQGYYPQGYYGQGYNDRRYYNQRYNRGYRCKSGTTGAIVGGAAGALLGREVARGGRDYYGNRRGNGTVGAIVGGALGALAGRQVTRTC